LTWATAALVSNIENIVGLTGRGIVSEWLLGFYYTTCHATGYNQKYHGHWYLWTA
jgi:hypothetical protein